MREKNNYSTRTAVLRTIIKSATIRLTSDVSKNVDTLRKMFDALTRTCVTQTGSHVTDMRK